MSADRAHIGFFVYMYEYLQSGTLAMQINIAEAIVIVCYCVSWVARGARSDLQNKTGMFSSRSSNPSGTLTLTD